MGVTIGLLITAPLGAWIGWGIAHRNESLEVGLQDERTVEQLDIGEGRMTASAGTHFSILPNGFLLQF
jgi:hypothetical protein